MEKNMEYPKSEIFIEDFKIRKVEDMEEKYVAIQDFKGMNGWNHKGDFFKLGTDYSEAPCFLDKHNELVTYPTSINAQYIKEIKL